jgi:hypothetical protein
MWKQDLYIAEQEGLRFVLAHSAAGHGQCKIAVGLRAKGFLTNTGICTGKRRWGRIEKAMETSQGGYCRREAKEGARATSLER